MRRKSMPLSLVLSASFCIFVACYKRNVTSTQVIAKYKAYNKTWIYYEESQNINYRFFPRNTTFEREYLKEEGGEPILIDNTIFKKAASGIKQIDIWHPDTKFYQ